MATDDLESMLQQALQNQTQSESNRYKEYYSKFDEQIESAKKNYQINKNSINDEIKSTVNKMNKDRRKLISDNIRPDCDINDLFNNLLESVNKHFSSELKGQISEVNYENKRTKDTPDPKIIISSQYSSEERKIFSIGEYPILVSVWDENKLEECLKLINKENPLDGKCKNIENYIVRPMNVCICTNGHHSQFSGVCHNSGTSSYIREIDISPIYNHIRFDGVYFKPSHPHPSESANPDLISMLDSSWYRDPTQSSLESQKLNEYRFNLVRGFGLIFELSRIPLIRPN